MSWHRDLIRIMLLAPRHFVRFVDGRYGETANIAHLPMELGAHIHALSTDILIRRDYAIKLKEKHSLRYEHFDLIQPAIEDGWAAIEFGRDLIFIYVEEERFHKTFQLVIKTANGGNELWVKTFYPIRESRYRKILSSVDVLRDHKQTGEITMPI